MKKKPLYKKALKFVRDAITVRPLRKWITNRCKCRLCRKKYNKIVSAIEEKFGENTVYIFQYQMFDKEGKECFNGGAERYVRDLADILTNNGFTAVLIQSGCNAIWYKDLGNLHIVGVPADGIFYYSFLRLFTKYKFIIYSGVYDWGSKIHPNILLSHGITWDIPKQNASVRQIIAMLNNVDNIVSVDTNTISWLRTTLAETMCNRVMHYLPNYVDTTLYLPTEKDNDGKIHVLFPRRASPERGYWLLSTILPTVMHKYDNVVFDFVGFVHGNEIAADMEKLARQFPGRITHCVVEPNKMPSIYQKADISLIPTLHSEGTSLSCLEAQACGNAVIATNIGGLPNLIIDGYNGVLINPTCQELLAALDKVIQDKDFRKKLSQNAVAVAKEFDKKVWAEKWENIISFAKK